MPEVKSPRGVVAVKKRRATWWLVAELLVERADSLIDASFQSDESLDEANFLYRTAEDIRKACDK